MVTTIVTAQKISEMTPNTFWLDTGTGRGSDGLKTVCTVYSGLVPMSPNTTPRAPTASAAWEPPRLITPPLRHAHPSGTPGTIHAADPVGRGHRRWPRGVQHTDGSAGAGRAS